MFGGVCTGQALCPNDRPRLPKDALRCFGRSKQGRDSAISQHQTRGDRLVFVLIFLIQGNNLANNPAPKGQDADHKNDTSNNGAPTTQVSQVVL